MSVELLANGSFDTAGATAFDAASWSRIDPTNAFRAAGFGEDGNAAFASVYGPMFGGGTADGRGQQSVAVNTGRTHQVTGRVKRANGNTGCELVDESSGDVIASITTASATDEWQDISGLYTPAASPVLFTVRNTADGAAINSSWYFDTLSFSEIEGARTLMRRGGALALTALFDRLKTINGSPGGYYSDIGQRVYVGLQRPQEPRGGHGYPYFCLMIDDSGTPGESRDAKVRQGHLDVRVFGFVQAGNALASVTGSTAEAVANLYDDIERAIMNDGGKSWDLGSTYLDNVDITDRQLISEQRADDNLPARVEVLVRLSYSYARANLGPSAT